MMRTFFKILVVTIFSAISTYFLAFILPPDPHMILYGINLPDAEIWIKITTTCVIIYFAMLLSMYEPSKKPNEDC